MKISTTLLAAAASGILMGISGAATTGCAGQNADSQASQTPAANGTSSTTAAAPHDCKQKNDCKGQGGCKSSPNGCKGKNDCKGQGGCKTM